MVAVGTRLCFYTLNTRGEPIINPVSIQHDPVVVNDTAPVTRWAYDILEPAGEERFRDVVDDIKAKCEALRSQ